MKVLHTSDWHLGRGFHGTDLRDAQLEMLSTICSAVEEHQVDVVLVAGDVFDRALPPEWAVRELGSCLQKLHQAGATVVMTSGNHDSAVRLGFNRELIALSGIHIRSGLQEAWEPVEISTEEERLLVYGVPYLEPQIYAEQLGVDRANHTAVMTEVIRRIREDLASRRTGGPRARVMVMAHVFAAHGTASESERNIGAPAVPEQSLDHQEETAGGLAVVPLELFEDFDYVALGHLHGRQRLSQRVRYSGSPIRYSFSEETQHKGAWLIDTARLGKTPQQDAAAEAISGLDWSIGRPLTRLKGGIEEMLDADRVEQFRDFFVQITLTDDQRPERAYQRLREVYPHLMQYSYAGAGLTSSTDSYAQRIQAAESELGVVAGFLQHVRGREASAQELSTVEAALEAVRAAPAAAGEQA